MWKIEFHSRFQFPKSGCLADVCLSLDEVSYMELILQISPSGIVVKQG